MGLNRQQGGEQSGKTFGRLRRLIGATAAESPGKSHEEAQKINGRRREERPAAWAREVPEPAPRNSAPLSIDPRPVPEQIVDLRDSVIAGPPLSLGESTLLSLGIELKSPTGRGRYDRLAPEAAAEKIFDDLRQGLVAAVDDGLLYYGKRPELEPRGFILAAERLNSTYWYTVSAAYNRQASRVEAR